MSQTKQHQSDAGQQALLARLNDIIQRYEVDTIINADALFETLAATCNPYDLLELLNALHQVVSRASDEAATRRFVPEIAELHAAMPLQGLAGLSYVDLQGSMDTANMAVKSPTPDLHHSQAAPDMRSLLAYCIAEAPKLTPKLKQLNRKSVAELNAMLVQPQKTVHIYGDKTFIDRDEYSVWNLSCLRELARASYMTYHRGGRLHASKRGAAWSKLENTLQVETLFRVWCEDANWDFWAPYYGGIGETVHIEQLMLFQIILALDIKYGMVEVAALDTVCASLCDDSNEPGDYGLQPFRYASYPFIVRPLLYLGTLSAPAAADEDFGIPQHTSLTSLGRKLLQQAIRESWSWQNSAVVCPDCRQPHKTHP